jgi:lipopolysaccharide transport system ATP-binding protein
VSANGATLVVEGVWKRYARGRSERRTLKRTLLHPGDVWQREWFWALQDINVRLARGETLALIGANGSGKSTLLRLMGGLGRPTRGRVDRDASIGAMMTLGESFDPLLTGRENAVTAGIVSGLTQKQAEARIDEIGAFAELEEFLDVPIRTYSDGMRLRLAFSVAISGEPDIMLIDEVLSVGDLRFQQKCAERLQELQARGTTIVLASHDQTQVSTLAGRALWLARGRMQALGSPEEVYDAYQAAMQVETARRMAEDARVPRHDGSDLRMAENRFGTLEVEIAAVEISPDHVERAGPDGRAPIRIDVDLVPANSVEDPIVGVSLHRLADGAMMFDVSTATDGVSLGTLDTPRTVSLVLDRLDVEPGGYRLAVGVYAKEWAYAYDYHWQAYPITVVGGGGFGPVRRWSSASTEPR